MQAPSGVQGVAGPTPTGARNRLLIRCRTADDSPSPFLSRPAIFAETILESLKQPVHLCNSDQPGGK